MQFALINNVKSEPFKGAKGICNLCLKEVIAKCGDIKVHHWAHLKTNACDKWWENETPWHRSWKNNYLADWREIIKRNQLTGEKHIADICTSHNLVIEFQHSPIDSIERISRESFYKNMVWVVDGLKNKFSRKRFQTWKEYAYRLKPSVYGIVHPNMFIPIQWLDSSVPVVFDFGPEKNNLENDEDEQKLYCLFPRIERLIIFAVITKKAFIKSTVNGEWQSSVANLISFRF
jgi:competence protein CoiA